MYVGRCDLPYAFGTDVNGDAMNTGFQYVLEATTDLLVNGLGYNETEVKDYYSQLGLETSSVPSIISYIEEWSVYRHHGIPIHIRAESIRQITSAHIHQQPHPSAEWHQHPPSLH